MNLLDSILNKKNKERIIYDEDVILPIMALSFEKGGKWKFLYERKKITVPNYNKDLLNLVDKGTNFGKGDAIRVKLQKIKDG